MNSKNLGFGDELTKSSNKRCCWIAARLRPHVEAYPSNLSHGRNRRKTPQITESKIGPKIPPKIMKKKNMIAQGRR
jgi:hypothetical protein